MPRPSKANSSASPARRQTTPWGQERRQEFIDFRLQWDGRINRSDLIERFGISVPQASADIAAYSELAPANLAYDRSERVYAATPAFSPAFPTTNSERYLNDLLAMSSGDSLSETSYVGWAPPIALANAPARAVPSDVLVAFVRAMRNGHTLNVLYQSMARPEPVWRELTPHGIGHDGFRWHVRAFCHTRQAFRDFVFARVLEVKSGEISDIRAENDEAWFSTVRLILGPSAGLSESRRRVVELDYAMANGELVMETRAAMLYYVLQRLGLSRDGELRPEAQQITLKNAQEVQTIIWRLTKSYD